MVDEGGGKYKLTNNPQYDKTQGANIGHNLNFIDISTAEKDPSQPLLFLTNIRGKKNNNRILIIHDFHRDGKEKCVL